MGASAGTGGTAKLTVAERHALEDAAREAVDACMTASAGIAAGAPANANTLPGGECSEEGWRPLLERVAELYARGADIDWIAFERNDAPSRTVVTLPTYAFQRQDHWALHDERVAPGADVVSASATPHPALSPSRGEGMQTPSPRLRGEGRGEGSSSAIDARPQTEVANDDWRRQLAAVDGPQRITLAGELIERAVKAVIGYGSHVPLDRERSLFDLGLDSLMSLELRDRVRAHAGVELPLAQLLADATIADLAARMLEAIESRRSGLPLRNSPIRHVVSTAAAVPHRSQMTTTLPLSYGQKALWFIHQSHPASPAYNVGVALRVRGEVDDEAMRRAFQILVDRHPSLRTVFSVEGDEPCQRILAEQPVSFRVVDASDLTDDELTARVQEDYRRPFD